MLWVCSNCKLCFRDFSGVSRNWRGKVSVKNKEKIKLKGRCDVFIFRFGILKMDRISVDIKMVKNVLLKINCKFVIK